MPRVVVLIEDDVLIQDALKIEITSSLNMEVESYYSAEDFLRTPIKTLDRIYLIDRNLPGINGVDLVKMIRQTDKVVPILMISGLRETVFITEALKSGADDFLIKPFNSEHLVAKIENAKIRTAAIQDNLIYRGLRLLPEASMIIKDGVKLKLTSREFQVFDYLNQEPGEIRSRSSVVSSFKDAETTERNIDFLIYSLRKKISKIGVEIQTVRGQGYRVGHPALL